MTTNFYPEMNESPHSNTQIIATVSHYGDHYYLKTWEKLSGRGIKRTGAADIGPNAGRPTYQVTPLAFKKLEQTYNISFESLL